MTRLSVITVAYNSAATIEQTLASVAAQTAVDVEHLVIDGASTDGSQKILEQYRSRLAHLVSEPDSGIYDAMNKGVRAATGDVIGFLNADDRYAAPDVLSSVKRTMERDQLDAVFGDVAFVSSRPPHRIVRTYSSRRFRPSRLAWGWMPAHPGLFVRRVLFDRFGLFSTKYRIAGDYEWIVRAFATSGVRYSYLPKVVVLMRTGGISTGGWRNTLLLNREVLRACRENGLSTNWAKILSKYPAKILEFVMP